MNIAPLTLLAVVLVSSFRMVHSDPSELPVAANALTSGSTNAPSKVADVTPVAPQAVVVEAKSPVDARPLASEQSPLIEESIVEDLVPPSAVAPSKNEQIWDEIYEAIYGLNELIGDELFLAVNRKPKGQMEIKLDDGLWKRVPYQTRVDLKTDISNLWHLYVREYAPADRSVVYFLDNNNDRVIDIFSKANHR